MDKEYFSFKEVQLESKNGKFYFEKAGNTKLVYEVPHEMFKRLLVQAANSQAAGVDLPGKANCFEYLFEQLVVNEALFAAMMYDNSRWKY